MSWILAFFNLIKLELKYGQLSSYSRSSPPPLQPPAHCIYLKLPSGEESSPADLIFCAKAAVSAVGLTLHYQRYLNIFDQKPNPESIFELDYHVNESLGVNYSAAAVLTPAQWYDILPAPEVIDLYEENDARLEGFYAEADEGYAWDTYTVKYDQTEGDGTFADNVPIFRYPEMLFIRAEARAEQGDFAGAQDDLNELQEARGMTNLSSFSDLDGAIDAIFEERRRELGFEGHRWFDLKRRAMDVPKAAHQATPTVPYTDYRILSPLPTSQVENNPQLENNPGY